MEDLYTIDVSSLKNEGKRGVVNTSPFPHHVFTDIFSPKSYKQLLEIWPDQESMIHNEDTDQRWFNLLSRRIHAKPWFDFRRDKNSKKILKLVKRQMMPFLKEAAVTLLPYFKNRFMAPLILTPKIIQLHEAGSRFKSQPPHVHFIHNPEYAFTVIFRIDDNGITNRGTRLYKSISYESDITQMLNATNGISEKTPAIDIDFVPNTAVAFVDSPYSIYGGMPFESVSAASNASNCKMIICHVAATRACYQDRPVFSAVDYQLQMEQWRKSQNLNDLNQGIIQWFEMEKSVVASWMEK